MLAVYKPFLISLKTYKNQDWKSRMNASELRILTQEICYYARNMLLRMISLSMRTVCQRELKPDYYVYIKINFAKQNPEPVPWQPFAV